VLKASHDSYADGLTRGPQEAGSLVTDCSEAFLQSALQQPITGVTQIVDQMLGTNLAKKTDFIGTPSKRKFGTIGWAAEEVATGAGAALPLIAAAAMTHGLVRNFVGSAIRSSRESTSYLCEYTSHANSIVGGFVAGAAFTPSKDNKNFWRDRLFSGTMNSMTLNLMHGIARPLALATGADAIDASLATKALNTGLSGALAGAGLAEISSHSDSGKWASPEAVVQSAISFGLTGAVLGTAGDALFQTNRPQSKFANVQDYVTRGYDNSMENSHYLGNLARKSVFDRAKLLLRGQYDDKIDSNRQVGSLGTGPRLNLSDWHPLDRPGVIARIEKEATSPLSNPQSINRFNAAMQKLGSGWESDNAEQLAKDFRKADNQLKAMSAKYEQLREENFRDDITKVFRAGGSDVAESNSETETANERLRKTMESARQQRNSTSLALYNVLSRRSREIQSAVNGFAREEGLLPVDVRVDNGSDSGAGYRLGTLYLSGKLLSVAKFNSQTSGIIFHELIHFEQDQTVIKRVADQVGIGATADADQLASLRQNLPQYREAAANKDWKIRRVLNTFLDSVLAHRNGKPLSQSESARADRLLAANEKYFDPTADQTSDTIAAMNNVREFARRPPLDTPFILTKLARRPQEYGFGKQPEELRPLIEKARSHYKEGADFYKQLAIDAESPMKRLFSSDEVMQVANVMSRQYRLLAKQLRKLSRQSYRQYMDNDLEREAYAGGELAHLSAQAQVPNAT
jgi:hypothetical protein